MGVQGLIEIKVSRKLLPSRGAPPCFVMNVRGSAVSLAGSSKCKPDVDMFFEKAWSKTQYYFDKMPLI